MGYKVRQVRKRLLRNHIEPAGSAFKFMAIQCKSCGTPFAVTDYYNTGALLKEQEKKIAGLESSLNSIQHTLNQIAYVLNQR